MRASIKRNASYESVFKSQLECSLINLPLEYGFIVFCFDSFLLLGDRSQIHDTESEEPVWAIRTEKPDSRFSVSLSIIDLKYEG